MESGVSIAVAILRDAYPRAEFPDRSVALYATMLADLDDLAVVDAVRTLVRTSTFLPSIAEIRRAVAEKEIGLPTAAEAWEMVNDHKMVGRLPGPVMKSLDSLGGRWSLRSSDNPGIFRAQFLKDYEQRREAAVRSAMGSVGGSSALPESTSIRMRPVMQRLTSRMRGAEVLPPTDDEKSDAIRVLEQGPVAANPSDDPLFVEATRILDEA